MREERDAMMLVRAELGERLAGLERLWAETPARTSTRASARASARDIAASISAIRTLAATYGLLPTVRLAEALERAVAQDGDWRRVSCPTALRGIRPPAVRLTRLPRVPWRAALLPPCRSLRLVTPCHPPYGWYPSIHSSELRDSCRWEFSWRGTVRVAHRYNAAHLWMMLSHKNLVAAAARDAGSIRPAYWRGRSGGCKGSRSSSRNLNESIATTSDRVCRGSGGDGCDPCGAVVVF